MLHADNHRIAAEFGRAAHRYSHYAPLQRDCAHQLMALVSSQSASPPAGTVLEIGCGTGFLTQFLIQQFSDRPLRITDLSPDMLAVCQTRLASSSNSLSMVQFQVLDGEQLPDTEHYALIISSFALQWFQHPIATLRRWVQQLDPGGWLVLAFPTCDSFPEWKAMCQSLQIPLTLNPLPDPQHLITHLDPEMQILQSVDRSIALTFSNATEFFHSFKHIGASINCTGKRLTPGQLRYLIQQWNQHCPDRLTVHYQIYMGIWQRRGE